MDFVPKNVAPTPLGKGNIRNILCGQPRRPRKSAEFPFSSPASTSLFMTKTRSSPWTDVAQLNPWIPTQACSHFYHNEIAGMCDGIRCDMGMLL
jgi:hypothetical protein